MPSAPRWKKVLAGIQYGQCREEGVSRCPAERGEWIPPLTAVPERIACKPSLHRVDHELPQFVDSDPEQPGCTLLPAELGIFRCGLHQRPDRQQCAGSFEDPLLRRRVEACAPPVVAKRRGGGLEG